MSLLYRCLLIGCAGFFGAVSRYLVTLASSRVFRTEFPIGTFVVNMTACLIVGVLWALSEERIEMAPNVRAIVFIGFLGSFSTFSTFILETNELMRAGHWVAMAGNALGQLVLGMALAFLGYALGRLAS